MNAGGHQLPLFSRGGGDQAIQHSDRHALMIQSPHNTLHHNVTHSKQRRKHYQESQDNQYYVYHRQNQVLMPEPNDDSMPAKYSSHDFASHNQPYRSNYSPAKYHTSPKTVPIPNRHKLIVPVTGIVGEGGHSAMYQDTKNELSVPVSGIIGKGGHSAMYQDPKNQLSVPVTGIIEKGGHSHSAMYQDTKNKPVQRPWYQVNKQKDFKKKQKEVRLNRGTLGPDLDNETHKDKALDYAKNVSKPAVKARPTHYNSCEVESQLSPNAKQGTKSPKHTQQVDVVNLKKLQQIHEHEKKKRAMMRQNMEKVP